MKTLFSHVRISRVRRLIIRLRVACHYSMRGKNRCLRCARITAREINRQVELSSHRIKSCFYRCNLSFCKYLLQIYHFPVKCNIDTRTEQTSYFFDRRIREYQRFHPILYPLISPFAHFTPVRYHFRFYFRAKRTETTIPRRLASYQNSSNRFIFRINAVQIPFSIAAKRI